LAYFVITSVITLWENKYLNVSTYVITMVVIKKKIIRIGNSLGIRLPKEALTICDLKEGDEVELQVESKNINILLKKKMK